LYTVVWDAVCQGAPVSGTWDGTSHSSGPGSAPRGGLPLCYAPTAWYVGVALIIMCGLLAFAVCLATHLVEHQTGLSAANAQCLICGIAWDLFNAHAQRAAHYHHEREHNPRDYVDYFETLLDCQRTSLSPCDEAVLRAYPFEVAWHFPFKRSLFLDRLSSGPVGPFTLRASMSLPVPSAATDPRPWPLQDRAPLYRAPTGMRLSQMEIEWDEVSIPPIA